MNDRSAASTDADEMLTESALSESTLPESVGRFVERTDPELLCRIETAADRVVNTWPGESVSDPSAVREPFADTLADLGVPSRACTLIESVTDRFGLEPVASPVPAPPYVVVTTGGVVLRSTLADGRLVMELAAFEVRTQPSRAYERRDEVAVTAQIIDRETGHDRR